jgi:hypothetical protein
LNPNLTAWLKDVVAEIGYYGSFFGRSVFAPQRVIDGWGFQSMLIQGSRKYNKWI